MQRITTSTKAIDLFGAGKHGFTDGNPSLGTPSTQLNAIWFNGIQEEIATVIETAGITLSGGDNTQLDDALAALYPRMDALQQVTGATTLVNSTSRKFIRTVQCISGGSYTVTLPMASACPSGSMIRIINGQSSGTITVSRQGSDLLYPNGSTVTSMALFTGDQVYLTSTGANWVVDGGTAQLPYSYGFLSSKTANGWRLYPDKSIEQWGNGITSSGFVAVTFPTAFPTAATAFVMTINGATVNGTWGAVESGGLGTTGVNVYSAAFGTAAGGAANSGLAFHWRATGY
ncbi:MAG: hypothetical protein IPI58_00040 [Alphaproteobacteria bacterium]|nr:MAG: hypothetical protein IPI58_00040 [Alphaproteobacteria bacterium]